MEECEECLCRPVCRCISCPKNMRAQLRVSSRSFDPNDPTVVELLKAVRGVESVHANLLHNRAEVRS